MWYAIISEDIENSLAKRLEARPAHLQRLQDLKDDGRLFAAGP
ncbi:MAG: YciI family protein, partial [Porticoccaceae bacterium]|nr:YciI family protein [Porticoccaceae bacterium]